MPGINFLDNKKHDHDQEPKDRDEKKDKLVWSNPKEEAKDSKSASFSLLSFMNKKEPADKPPASIIDKNKIKKSREEILNLIKHHESSKSLPKEKSKNFLEIWGEKLKKQPGHKEVLIDYQRVFNQEKEHKNQVGKIFNIKPAPETVPPPLAEKFKDDWFRKLIMAVKRKIIALSAHKNETVKIIKLPEAKEIKPAEAQPIARPEEKPAEAEVKEINIKKKEPIRQDESRQRILETNLIRGELVTFFDWRSKVVISVSAILTPILIIGAVHYALAFYQKSSQVKNLTQAQKFAELEQGIIKEESGIKEVFDFQTKLKIVSKIFEQHIYWTNFFKFLENNTIKDVYFINFDGDTSGKYAMGASAVDYGGIAEQINVFRNNEKIIAALAEGGELAAGNDINKSLVKFVLNFSIAKNIFTE